MVCAESECVRDGVYVGNVQSACMQWSNVKNNDMLLQEVS